MKQSLYIGKEPNFQKIVVASAVLHILFITLVAIPIKKREREYKSYFVNLVGPTEIRRAVKTPAVKGTKKTEGKGPVKMKASPRRRVRPKSKADMSLEPAKSVAKEIDRLRALSALAKLKKKKEDERSDKLEEIRQKLNGKISISKGPSISTDVQSIGSESYHAIIIQEIQNEWVYPDFDVTDLEVIISFQIDKAGKVISHAIVKSSGNTLFDRSAIKAILKASPLTPHPVEREIEVRFRL